VNGLTLRLATRADDAQIRAVLRRNIMPGAIELAFAHEPSFFDAIEVAGRDPQVVVGEQDGQLVGAGLVTIRRVYLNGKASEVGYLSSLRVDPAIRGTTALARGYRFYRRMHEAQRRVPFYLSTIMEGNSTARELLTSRRAGLPSYHEIGRYHTTAIPLLRQGKLRLPADLRIVAGSAVGAGEIAAFLRETGKSRQYYPIYTADDLQAPTGLLSGLVLDDFAVALTDDRIQGVIAAWNQLPFRQHVVTGYQGWLRWAQPLLGRLLPPPGEPVRSLLAACIAIRDDDPAVFRALFRHLLHVHTGGAYCFLFVGLAGDDPLLPVAREPWHLTLHSRIYTVEWGDGRAALQALDDRAPYLELGSL
jgi:hypothetical protein